MEIEFNEKNKIIVFDSLAKTIDIIKQISGLDEKELSDKKRLVLLDLLYRQFPNLNTIHLLFKNYFLLINYGNIVPIGLVMRCSLEDMIFALYLLSFKNNSEIFENEILVQSRNSIQAYVEFVISKESEHWLCSEEKKEELKSEHLKQYNAFKLERSHFFDQSGKLKDVKNMRENIQDINVFFDSTSIKKHGPANMFNRLKNVDKDLSYIYFEYKFYCLYEHYSFHTREIMELNNFTFGHLSISLDCILTALKQIIEYLYMDCKFATEIENIQNELMKLIDKKL